MSIQEKELLFNLRSKFHSSKVNFKKMHRNDLKCIFNCPDDEDQIHSFTKCLPILSRVNNAYHVSYQNIFGTLQDQKQTIKVFIQIKKTRNHVKKYHSLPGRETCQDPCTFGPIPNGAADVIHL